MLLRQSFIAMPWNGPGWMTTEEQKPLGALARQPDSKPGMVIGELSEPEFLDFAGQFANSPEVGQIRTCLDDNPDDEPGVSHVVMGLWGCDTLCAVATFQFYRSKSADIGETLKLDSVIVDPGLRRRGLAGLLIAKSFGHFVADRSRQFSRIYAHSVHPATVSLLRRLGFADPAPAGAPVSYLELAPGADRPFANQCETGIRHKIGQMRVQCELCRKSDRRARPWCQPR